MYQFVFFNRIFPFRHLSFEESTLYEINGETSQTLLCYQRKHVADLTLELETSNVKKELLATESTRTGPRGRTGARGRTEEQKSRGGGGRFYSIE
jgi:hypothetical protein